MSTDATNRPNPSGVTLRGRWVALRPVQREDLPLLYQWRIDPQSLYLWSALRRLPSFDEFVQEMEQLATSTNYFVAEDALSSRLIGFVYAYNSSAIDGFAFFSLFIVEEFRSRLRGAEVGLLFLNYMFTYYNLRKMYAEVYEFNDMSRRTLTTAGFRQEGHCPGHLLYDSRYWALDRFALYRDDWATLKCRLRRLFGAHETSRFIERPSTSVVSAVARYSR